jgi:hypothetical protein
MSLTHIFDTADRNMTGSTASISPRDRFFLECIVHFIGSALFNNPEIQIQLCSPGRLSARRSALLAIGFYLGSDTLRRYTLGDLATSFSENQHCYWRGRRLVLYDAEGDFDRNFDPRQARLPVVRTDLTAYRGRCWRNAVCPARRGRLGRARAAVKKKRHSHSGRPCKPVDKIGLAIKRPGLGVWE